MPITFLVVSAFLGFYPQNDFQYKDNLVQYRPSEMHVFCAVCASPTPKTVQKRLPVNMPELAQLPRYLIGTGVNKQEAVNKNEDTNSQQIGKQAAVEITKVKENSSVSCAAVVEEVFFDFNSAALSQSEKDKLNRLVTGKKIKKIYLTGFTDQSGRTAYNNELALKRSSAVKDYLVSKGLDSKTIELKGYGKCCYVAKATQSRRVEIKGLCETVAFKSD